MPAKRRYWSTWTVVAGLLASPALGADNATTPPWIATGKRAMVATDHPEASRVGVQVLRSGGNAIDAAIAVSFALGVVRPYSTGLGGGGFLIVRFADSRDVHVLDYRETAPLGSSPDMFTRAAAANSNGPSPSETGHLAVAVPNLPFGLAEAHNRWATMPMSHLIQPAIHLAETGFDADEDYVRACRKTKKRYDQHPELKESCPYVYRTHLHSGDLPKVGDRVHQPALARLLQLIADEGVDVLRIGVVADALAEEMKEHGGIITRADLASPRVKDRQPLRGTYRGFEIITMPPPSSGGTCLLEALNVLETVNLPDVHKREPFLATHLTIEAMKHAFADRARWMADSDFAHVPTDLLTSKPYAQELARSLSSPITRDADTYGTHQIPEDSGTSHFCIIDPQGNCVVSTETINTRFGSLAAVNEWGLILNNEMDDFAAQAGEVNHYGLVQSQRNAPQPGKRPLSSMSPTIVCKDNKPFLLLGGSGGPRIISSVLNMLIDVVDYDLPLEKAMEARRVHHQWQPDEVVFDRAPNAALAKDLAKRGHVLSPHRRTGIIQIIHIRNGQIVGASDPRKGGRPAGY